MSLHSPRSNLSAREVLTALTSSKRSVDGQERFTKNIILSKASLSSSGSTDADQAADRSSATPVNETIHYLSPVSGSRMSPRSGDEGDFSIPYKTPSFMRFLHEFGKEFEGSYVSSSISCVEPELQRTLAIVKPEYVEFEDAILRAITDVGFRIIKRRLVHLTPEQVSEIYAQHYGSPSFPHMVVRMSVGPILSLCLAGQNAVAKWKEMVGPDKSIRAEWFFPISMRVRFGLHEELLGALHASENLTEATIENRYINPEGILEPLLTEEEKVCDYCNLYLHSTLLNGLTEIVRVKPADPILYLADWLLKNNPYQPQFPPEMALLPT